MIWFGTMRCDQGLVYGTFHSLLLNGFQFLADLIQNHYVKKYVSMKSNIIKVLKFYCCTHVKVFDDFHCLLSNMSRLLLLVSVVWVSFINFNEIKIHKGQPYLLIPICVCIHLSLSQKLVCIKSHTQFSHLLYLYRWWAVTVINTNF